MIAIYSFKCITGASVLFDIKPNKKRRYSLTRPVEIHAVTDVGTLIARTEPGFQFDLFLKLWLRDMAAYSSFKSEVIRKAVSLSKSWYGVPTPDDPWFCNVNKVMTEWRPNG